MGFIRFILAICVIAAHTGGIKFFMNGNSYSLSLVSGREAVALFFMISGFYVSMILSGKYTGKNAFKIFYINRFLRLMPSYWVVLLCMGIFLGKFSELGRMTENFDFLPKIAIWLSNVMIIGTDFLWYFSFDGKGSLNFAPFMIEATHNGKAFLIHEYIFSVSLEIAFYLIAPFFVSNIRKTFAVFLMGILYYVWAIFTNHTQDFYLYHVFFADLLYFCLGIFAFMLYKKILVLEGNTTLLYYLFGIILLAIPLICHHLLVIAFFFAIPSLFHYTQKNKWDRWVGDLSYPIYLSQAFFIQYFYQYPLANPYYTGLYATLLSILVAIALLHLVDKPIDHVRQKLVKRFLAHPE